MFKENSLEDQRIPRSIWDHTRQEPSTWKAKFCNATMVPCLSTVRFPSHMAEHREPCWHGRWLSKRRRVIRFRYNSPIREAPSHKTFRALACALLLPAANRCTRKVSSTTPVRSDKH